MRNNGDIFINLKSLSITFMTIYMLTAFLYVSIFNSLTIQMFILCAILGILLINGIIIKKEKYILNTIDILVIVAIFAVIGSMRISTFTPNEIASPIIFSLGILISLFIRGNIENYNYSFSLIKWGSVFYALSVIFSYLLPDLYDNLFLSLLRPDTRQTILLNMQEGYYTGFTSQVAFTAGYIVNGLGIICCGWIISRKGKTKKGILLFFIMLIALLLTQKRAHLFFMLMSCFLVYIQYSRFSYEKIKKLYKVVVLCVCTIIFFIIMTRISSFAQTLFLRIILTIQDFFSGEDITSGRSGLYSYAWELFKQHPIFGIGWGNYKEATVGVVTVEAQLNAHNIYIQLLSETGIVGTGLILIPFITTYFYTIKITRIISRNRTLFLDKWIFAVLYSLYSQTFFLLYGLTGNPLYDNSFLMMYFLAIGLIYSFWKCNKVGSIYART